MQFGPGNTSFFPSYKAARKRPGQGRHFEREGKGGGGRVAALQVQVAPLQREKNCFAMAGIGQGKPGGLALSKGCFQRHLEIRAALFFVDLTQYPQLRAPGVTVERILPSTFST